MSTGFAVGKDAGDASDPAAKPRLGLKVAEPDKALRRRYRIGPGEGVVVLGVEDGSRAEDVFFAAVRFGPNRA